MSERELQRPIPTSGRRWKLAVTLVALFSMTVGALVWLVSITATVQGPLEILSIYVQRSWLVAALGGAVGGLARALYVFLLDNYAFHYRHITGRSSPYVKKAYGIEDEEMEDDFDPLECWHLYFMEPLVGATLGLLFALAVDLGLISLGGDIGSEDKRMMRLVVMAGLAGLFAENVLHKLQGFLAKP
jgi:hypothetical protein